MIKECWEEAGVPQDLARKAQPVGFVSYVSMSDQGLKPDVLFCYDLELPEDFLPKPQDGEVRSKTVGLGCFMVGLLALQNPGLITAGSKGNGSGLV